MQYNYQQHRQNLRYAVGSALGDVFEAINDQQTDGGAGVPFVNSHKSNEEIYGVISGKGKAVIDGEKVALAEDDWLRVAPKAKRQFSAAADSGITFVCIQVKENSLGGFTADDAVVY